MVTVPVPLLPVLADEVDDGDELVEVVELLPVAEPLSSDPLDVALGLVALELLSAVVDEDLPA